MTPKIYIDTSVIGGCFDQEFEEWSLQLFEEFRLGLKIAVISDITLDELEDAPKQVRDKLLEIPETNIEMLLYDTDVEELASKYIAEGAVTIKFFEDALHIALATIYKVDILASWNFKHIVNVDRIRKYNAVNIRYGYSILEIRNPREILSSDNEKDE